MASCGRNSPSQGADRRAAVGPFATLLRGTVEAMLPEHDVYITDWTDARDVPLSKGRFGLDDYIDYVMQMVRHLGPKTHIWPCASPAPPASPRRR